MRTLSSVASIMIHVGLGVGVLLGTARSGRSDPPRPIVDTVFFQPATSVQRDGGGFSIPAPISVAPPDLGAISVSTQLPQTGALVQPFSPLYPGSMNGSSTYQPSGLGGALLTEGHAEVLTGPLPVYPDLLRQAGVQGRVVLEAVVDTTGRVLAQSISIVSATNPGFIAPARQALLATLFRPAMIGGTAVRMRVQIPYEFAIRNGTERAR